MTNAEITDVYVRDVTSDEESKVIDIAWSTRAHGFGVLTILQMGGETRIQCGCHSTEFVKRVLCKLVDIAVRGD